MPHDVFISYATADKQAAEAIYAALRGKGITCWMAPHDIPAGALFAGAICEAIEASKVVVLVFSPRRTRRKWLRATQPRGRQGRSRHQLPYRGIDVVE